MHLLKSWSYRSFGYRWSERTFWKKKTELNVELYTNAVRTSAGSPLLSLSVTLAHLSAMLGNQYPDRMVERQLCLQRTRVDEGSYGMGMSRGRRNLLQNPKQNKNNQVT